MRFTAMMRTPMMRTLWVALLLTPSPLIVPADADDAGAGEEELDERFVLLNRPKEDTPSEQLGRADHLWQAGKTKQARRAYRALIKRWPTSLEAPAALYREAVILQQQGKLRRAFQTFQDLIERHTGRFPYDAVLQRQFDIAVAYMNDRVGDFLFLPGFSSPERALDMLEQIVENGRRSPHAPEAQFLIGRIHESVKDYDLAVVAYLETSLLYPSSPFAEKAAFGRARCLVALSDQSPYDQKLAEEAWYALTVFNTTYPRSEYADKAGELGRRIYERRAEALFEIARYYDSRERPDAAIAEYQSVIERFPNSPLADRARDRIRRLQTQREKEREP